MRRGCTEAPVHCIFLLDLSCVFLRAWPICSQCLAVIGAASTLFLLYVLIHSHGCSSGLCCCSAICGRLVTAVNSCALPPPLLLGCLLHGWALGRQ